MWAGWAAVTSAGVLVRTVLPCDRDPVGELFGFGQVVGGQHHRQP